MKSSSKFNLEATPIIEAIKKAVNEGHQSLSEIAGKSGLSVPTIARIYSEDVGFVQSKTARRIAEALGYEISRNGAIRLQEQTEKPHSGKLTTVQKARLLKGFQRLLNEL